MPVVQPVNVSGGVIKFNASVFAALIPNIPVVADAPAIGLTFREGYSLLSACSHLARLSESSTS